MNSFPCAIFERRHHNREDIERKIREKEELEFAGPTQFMRFVEELYAQAEASEGVNEDEEKLRMEAELERIDRGEPSMMMASSANQSPISTHNSSLATTPIPNRLTLTPPSSSSTANNNNNGRPLSAGSRLEDDLRRVESQYQAEVEAAARRRAVDGDTQRRLELQRQSLLHERQRLEDEKKRRSNTNTSGGLPTSISTSSLNGSLNGQQYDTTSSASTPTRSLEEQRDELIRRLADLRMREERDRDELAQQQQQQQRSALPPTHNNATPNHHSLHVSSNSTSSLRVSPIPSPSISPAAGPLGGAASVASRAHLQPDPQHASMTTPPISQTNRPLNIVSAQPTPAVTPAASVPPTVRATYSPVPGAQSTSFSTLATSSSSNGSIPPVPAVVPAGYVSSSSVTSPVRQSVATSGGLNSPSRIPMPSALPKRPSVSSPTQQGHTGAIAGGSPPSSSGGGPSNSLAAAAAAAEEKARRDMETKARLRAEAEAAERKRQAEAAAAAEEAERARLLAAQAAQAEAERVEAERIAVAEAAQAAAIAAAAADPVNDPHVQQMMKGVTLVKVPRVGKGKPQLIKLSRQTDGIWVLDALPNITGVCLLSDRSYHTYLLLIPWIWLVICWQCEQEKPFPLHSIRISRGMRDGQFSKRNLEALYGRQAHLCMSFVHSSTRSFDLVATNQAQFDLIFGVVTRLAT
jgi:hypothetical protein